MNERFRSLSCALLVLVALTKTGRAQESSAAGLRNALSRESLTNKILLSARSARDGISWTRGQLESARQDARRCADAAVVQSRTLEAARLARERAQATVQEAHVTAVRFAAAADRLRAEAQAARQASSAPSPDALAALDAAITGREEARDAADLAVARASKALVVFAETLGTAEDARSLLMGCLDGARLRAAFLTGKAKEAASRAGEMLATDQRADELAKGTSGLVVATAALESSWTQMRNLAAFAGDGTRAFEDVKDARMRAIEIPDDRLDAELRLTTEQEARRYLVALRAANLEDCPVESPCRQDLEREVAWAGETLLEAYETAHKEDARLAEAVAGLQGAEASLAKLIERSGADEKRAEVQELATAAGVASVTALSREADSAVEWAEREHEVAVKAADEAYLAVFGKSRPVPPDVLEAPGPALTAVPAPVPVPEVAAAPSARIIVVDHVYEALLVRKPESSGYAAYTYVLFGRKVGKGLTELERSRYGALVQAIVQSTAIASELKSDRSKLNIFCIPSKRRGQLDENVSEYYDSSLAFALLGRARGGAVLAPEILRKLQNSAGPFLLTFPRELGITRTTDPMLFADLSRVAPVLFPQIVAVYKSTLTTGTVTERKELEVPMKLVWASGIANTAGEVQPIIDKIADLIRTFTEKKPSAAG